MERVGGLQSGICEVAQINTTRVKALPKGCEIFSYSEGLGKGNSINYYESDSDRNLEEDTICFQMAIRTHYYQRRNSLNLFEQK